MYEMPIDVSFGDCDPAGIVFYPNYLRWFDQTFHRWLATFGVDQRIIAERLDAVGTGLVDCGARFRVPVRPGDRLIIALTLDGWTDKTLKLTYRGMVNGRPAVEGHELRGLFVRDGDKLRAAPITPVRALIEASGAATMEDGGKHAD